MSESNQRSKTLIRELYELSESGALDQIDSKVVDSACDFIQNFINPVVCPIFRETIPRQRF